LPSGFTTRIQDRFKQRGFRLKWTTVCDRGKPELGVGYHSPASIPSHTFLPLCPLDESQHPGLSGNTKTMYLTGRCRCSFL
jgi:hypothetical protein